MKIGNFWDEASGDAFAVTGGKASSRRTGNGDGELGDTPLSPTLSPHPQITPSDLLPRGHLWTRSLHIFRRQLGKKRIEQILNEY